MGKLGEELHIVAFAVRGSMAERECSTFVAAVTFAIGMHPAGRSISYCYPTAEGKGGVGFTHFQPITESFVVFDAWPDLAGGYLIISSCRRFDAMKVREVIRFYRLQIVKETSNTLSIKKGEE